MFSLLGAALCGIAMLCSTSALADPVADFYRGKQIRFIIRTTPRGDYDQYTRLLARFMGKHIPGNPALIPINMPGGGGITAANFMAQVAPRDGTVIGIVSQGLAADQALSMSPQLKADLREFNWIANVVFSNQLLVVWHTSPTKTLADAKLRETTIGTTGAGSASVQYPAFYNNVLGTKFKIVFGYPGGQHIDFAMERGEVEGRGTNPYSGWMASKPTWIPQKLIIPLIQSGVEKEPALPDVPLILDQPVKPQDKPLLEFMARAATVGRPLATTPGVPAERVAALRDAFAATIRDPEFIAAAANERLEIRPMPAGKLSEIITGLLDAPAGVRERVKAALQPKDEHMLKGAPGQR
jgi:tripartite-type tricarboxylate transporter receptor subunit TctC